MKKILALDLGTKTGWALSGWGAAGEGEELLESVSSGTWHLSTEKDRKAAAHLRLDRRGDPRVFTLKAKIERLLPLDLIVFEDVQFLSTQLQAQLWASLRAVVWLQATNLCRVDCLNVSALKKFATGSGAADKDAMARAIAKKMPARFVLTPGETYVKVTPEMRPADDNEVDAAHLLLWAQQAFR